MVVEEGKRDDTPLEGGSTLYRVFTPKRLTIRTQLSLVYALFVVV